jgi:LuxR family transcriptional regulator, maltose regulon positive regulatory protein
VTAEQVDPRLVVPPLPPRHVARPRLLAALDDSAGLPLVLVAAGPGSGKTVLLADWALAQKVPVGWISLTAADAAPRRFWSLVCSALRACTGQDAFASAVAANPTADGVRSLLGSLSAAAVPPVLVIDDAHLLTHPAVHDGLDLLIRARPPRLRLVLAARSDPLLPMHRYRLAGLMRELRAAELAMTRGEVRELLLAHGVTLRPEDLDRLLARTEGWVAGLRLSAMRMEGTDNPARFVSELALGQGSIGEYLMAEVLDRQPEPVRRMLAQTSFLDEVTAPLAEAITGLDGCADMLAGLARKNSFVVPVDAAQTRFRYHQLFAEILRHDVQWRERQSVPGLMRRAGAHFERIGDFRNALYWAARSGDAYHAASLLARGGLAHALVHRQDLSGLNLGSLQETQIPGEPGPVQAGEAAVARSAAAAVMADAESAARELRTQDQTVIEQVASPELLVTARLVRLLLGMKAGDAQAVDEAVGRLYTRSGDPPGYRIPGLPAAVTLAQASTQFWQGRNEDVGALLQTALKEAEAGGPPVLELNVLAMIALVDSLLSRPHHAEEATSRAYAMLRTHGNLSAPVALELAAAGRSLIAADLNGAAQALERAAIPGDAGFDPGLVAARAIGQATLLLARGDLTGARAVMNRASSRTNLLLLKLLRQTLLADIETLLGRPNAALSLLQDYLESDLAVLVALPRARAFLALRDWPRAQHSVRSVLTATSTLVSRYSLLEAMLFDARIAQLKGDPGRALEMISSAIELAQDDIVLPFFAMQGVFASLLARHPAVAAKWPLLPAGVPVDEVMPGGRPAPADLPDPLTEREHAALRFLATGLSTAEIADEMCLSVNTVKTHLAAIYRKLAASRRKEAVLRARELELI